MTSRVRLSALWPGRLPKRPPRIAQKGIRFLASHEQYHRGRKLLTSMDLRARLFIDWGANRAARLRGRDLPVEADRNESSRNIKSRGFTLVEILIVLAIVVTLSALAIPSLLSAIYQAKVARAVADINAIETDILGYQATNGQFPDDLSQIGDDALLDPWHNPYQYLNHTNLKGNGKVRKDRFLVPLNSDFDLYSMGADGQTVAPITSAKSQDDIIRASDGAYIGLASQF
jgi:general secretion pathway protein G